MGRRLYGMTLRFTEQETPRRRARFSYCKLLSCRRSPDFCFGVAVPPSPVHPSCQSQFVCDSYPRPSVLCLMTFDIFSKLSPPIHCLHCPQWLLECGYFPRHCALYFLMTTVTLRPNGVFAGEFALESVHHCSC